MDYAVAVLERGEEIVPGEFPDTPAKAADQFQARTPVGHVGSRTALFDLHVGEDISVLVGCGLGGTSLINANVSLRPDPRVFDDPAWPAPLKDSDLEAGYSAACDMLRPVPYSHDTTAWPSLNKLSAMQRAGSALAATAICPPLNVSFTDGPNAAGVHQPACNLCGDCCSGCNTGAKTTTAMCYLPDAVNFGAQIFCGAEVQRVERRNGRWVVHYRLLGLGREVFSAPEATVTADILVLAAGTLGSTEILLRSRERGLPLSPALGRRFSGNGDVLGFAYNNDTPIDGIGIGHDAADYDWRSDGRRPVGPTITGLIDLRGTTRLDDGMVIEEGAIPGALAATLPAVMCAGALAFGTDTDLDDLSEERRRELESLFHGAYRGAVNHTQTFLVMAHDGADGTMALSGDRITVKWPGIGSRPVFKAIARKLEAASGATGGSYVPNPAWTRLMDQRLVTVHPLGGCPMGVDASSGVVDERCRVFDGAPGNTVHQGLYVCDGSIIPRSLGVNPLLTISAISERAMVKLAADNGRVIRTGPAIATSVPGAPEVPGIRFTEKMAGDITLNASSGRSAAAVILTIHASDGDRFIRDARHEAEIVGTVEIAALCDDTLTVHGGRFNLFTPDPARVETRQMEYRMPLAAGDGRRFYFHGVKTIHDDPGFDLWRDTTTLQVNIHQGEDAGGPLVASGELRIDPADFVRQLRTVAVPGARSLAERLEMVRRFGFLFAGELFTAFGGPFARPSLFDPGKARVRRPLRVNEPEVHPVRTADGLDLRLTRYRGGDKGPVIFSHGLGVSSLIFSIDTIDTNLLEYIHAAGYDCWLLDHRSSIELPHAREQHSADALAKHDYPAAIGKVRSVTGKDEVQVVAHCYGAMTFAMAMLDGLAGVRSAVISQIATHADVPFFPQRLLAHLRAPNWMRLAGTKALDARAKADRDWLEHFVDSGLAIAYPYRRDDRSRSATSRRVTALYGQLYQMEQLNQATLDAMPEMFGQACIEGFLQLARIARAGRVVRADGSDTYLGDTNLRRFAVPTLFVHGELNRAFLPSGTDKTVRALSASNGAGLYERVVIPATGHIDCIFGKNAADTVYPHILRHLERTRAA
jgi:cholesterol oxidase